MTGYPDAFNESVIHNKPLDPANQLFG